MKYQVRFTERNFYDIEVEANSPQEAEDKVMARWSDGEVTSSEAHDCDTKDIDVIEA